MNSLNNPQKNFYIHTLGCKVNQYESQAMREILLKAGFKECLSKEIADIYIINTCTVTHHADRESRYLIGMFHRANPKARIVVAGCYMEKNADEVSFLPGVAHIVKNDEKSRIAEILNGSNNCPLSTVHSPLSLSITSFKGHTKAFVKIQDGCENRCSYCKVPLVRSVLRSKPLDKIVEEVKLLVSNGFKEIVLAGICLGAWGKDLFSTIVANGVGLSGANIVDVLRALEKIGGDFRIRLSSIEPKYVTDELIAFMADSKKTCKHLHIPLQSGDDEILRRMNRPYTAAEYAALIAKAKSAIKDIAISTDIMVAFPGESDANFRNTLKFFRSIMPARTHIFTYSKRDGTPAYMMGPEIEEAVAKKRYYDLRTIALMSSCAYRTAFINRTVDVLVEAKRDRNSGLLTGYSDNYIKVLFEGTDDLMGRIVPVKIEDVNLTYTVGAYEPK